MRAQCAQDDGEGGEQRSESGQGDGGHAVTVCHASSPRNPACMKCCAFPSVAVAIALVGAALAQDADPATENFEKLPAGPPPDAFMVIDGGWGIVEEAGNKVLELQAEPVVDAAILIGPSLQAGASIRAKIKAAKSRRAHPRMGVGLYGVSGVKLRLVPAQKKIEMLVGEEIVADAPFDTWTENVWWLVELKVSGTGDAWTADARVWVEGTAPPTAATVIHSLPTAPGQGRASLVGSPYANKPVHFDEVIVQGDSAPK